MSEGGLLMSVTNAEYVDGWELAWVHVHTQNYQGGDVSTVVYPYQPASEGRIVDFSEYAGPAEAFLEQTKVRKVLLTTRTKLQFPFAEQFTCQLCDVISPTHPALMVKQTLLALAYEKSGINTWITGDDDRPFWCPEDFFDPHMIQIDAWGKLSAALLNESWTNGYPAEPTFNRIQQTVVHCKSGLFGLTTKKSPPTKEQSEQFLNYASELGLFAPGDPGPGGNLFEGSLPITPSMDVMSKMAVLMEKSSFSRPARPNGWDQPIATFQLRCAHCALKMNPSFAYEISEAIAMSNPKSGNRTTEKEKAST